MGIELDGSVLMVASVVVDCGEGSGTIALVVTGCRVTEMEAVTAASSVPDASDDAPHAVNAAAANRPNTSRLGRIRSECHNRRGDCRQASMDSRIRLIGPIGRAVGCQLMGHRFESVQEVRDGLKEVHYLADEGIAGVAFLADRLGKPVLVEGPAGTGKTQLAKSVAEMTGARLIRLQCYEGLDESKALYEWNYKKQLLRIQADRNSDSWNELHDDIFSDEFLLTRPLLEAITADDPVVLLIDEVDRVEVETEALLLEILSEYQVSIPEMGTIIAKQIPLVFLTSNNTRELSEALKRRCLYLHIDYPDMEREKEIVLTKVPEVSANLADQIARIVRSIRQLDLKKAPSVSETIDWARTLVLLGIDHIEAQQAKETLHILLKYQTDIAKAAKELSVDK
jgi:MoxR-like ATPase